MNKISAKIQVTKLTDKELMQEACESTFLGKSGQTLLSIYKSEHSPARTQMFWIQCEDIPLYISTHLLRHHVGSQPFALTHRTDRNGGGYDLSTQVSDIKQLMDELENYTSEIEREKVIKAIHDRLDNIAKKGGRNTPTNLSLLINAQSLIDMAKLRLCKQASKETIEVFKKIKEEVRKVDPDLASLLVSKCVYRNGICGEPKPCGYINSNSFNSELLSYVSLFNK